MAYGNWRGGNLPPSPTRRIPLRPYVLVPLFYQRSPLHPSHWVTTTRPIRSWSTMESFIATRPCGEPVEVWKKV